jgi:hypothetical protein
MRRDVSSPEGALAFVEKHGIVLESGRGPVPSLAHAIAGEEIRGTWWGHPKGRAIFRATRAMRDSADVLVCRLVGGKITYVHRRLWPALVRLAGEIGPRRLDAIQEQHTKSGAHVLVTKAFPKWVPKEVMKAAATLTDVEARKAIGLGPPAERGGRASVPTDGVSWRAATAPGRAAPPGARGPNRRRARR